MHRVGRESSELLPSFSRSFPFKLELLSVPSATLVSFGPPSLFELLLLPLIDVNLKPSPALAVGVFPLLLMMNYQLNDRSKNRKRNTMFSLFFGRSVPSIEIEIILFRG